MNLAQRAQAQTAPDKAQSEARVPFSTFPITAAVCTLDAPDRKSMLSFVLSDNILSGRLLTFRRRSPGSSMLQKHANERQRWIFRVCGKEPIED